MMTSVSLMHELRPLRPLLGEPSVTEVCINRPGEAFVESDHGWTRHELPELTFEWANAFARTLATSNERWVDRQKTLLSATMPEGERVNIVFPPSCEPDTVAITIRKPSPSRITHSDLAKGGIYRQVKRDLAKLDPVEEELLALYEADDYERFIPLAVASHRNVVASGPTGSGKTTFTNALVEFIPSHERVITIEDVWEARLPNHPNHVHLFYEADGATGAGVTVDQLLRATLRMRPDRPILSEIRGAEAYDFLTSVMSGHPGALTSIHASSAYGVVDRIAFLIEGSGKRFTRELLDAVILSTVDVICQFALVYEGGVKRRVVSEMYYDPHRKRKILADRALS